MGLWIAPYLFLDCPTAWHCSPDPQGHSVRCCHLPSACTPNTPCHCQGRGRHFSPYGVDLHHSDTPCCSNHIVCASLCLCFTNQLFSVHLIASLLSSKSSKDLSLVCSELQGSKSPWSGVGNCKSVTQTYVRKKANVVANSTWWPFFCNNRNEIRFSPYIGSAYFYTLLLLSSDKFFVQTETFNNDSEATQDDSLCETCVVVSLINKK